MALTNSTIEQVAAELLAAERERVPIAALSERYPETTFAEAYQIQRLNVDARARAGARIVGAKVGFSSKAMREQFKVPEPNCGVLFDHMIWREGAVVDHSSLILPMVEAEIAFVLGEDLEGPGVNAAQAAKATAGVMASLEVLESRFKDWKVTVIDSTADDAEACGTVLGGRLTPLSEIEPRLLGVAFSRNGQVVSTGAGAAALGNPVDALAWVANKLGSLGIGLKKGHIVITGSLIRAVAAEPGDVFSATFDRLGAVTVKFE